MVAFDNFAILHPDGRFLTEDLLATADLRERGEFFAFMLLWMSFNGWMACVTGHERDSEMIRDVGNDRRLSEAFLRLLERNPHFADNVRRFSTWWPIFNVQSVRARKGRDFLFEHGNRNEFVRAVVHDDRIKRRPANWVAGLQPRWGDLLAAIYQVRCNLFHGDKSPRNETDRELVQLSYLTLRDFIEGSGCYRWNDARDDRVAV